MTQSFAADISHAAANNLSDFEQLDAYSLMNILDLLPSEDLIKIAAINPRIADIIIKRYIISKYQFHEKQITIVFDKNEIFSFYAHSNGNRVYLSRKTSETLLVLEIFGHTLNHLYYLFHHIDDKIAKTVFDYAVKYSPQSAKDIEFRYIRRAQLANFSYTFDHTTTKVIIRSNCYNFIPLNELFPFMESVIFGPFVKPMIPHCPKLTNCTIQSLSNDDENKNVHELIRLNPQLKHFHTPVRNNASYVRYISQMLPNLESLSLNMQIDSVNTDSEIIHFENLKEFTFQITRAFELDQRTVIGNIRFGQLKTLNIKHSMDIDKTQLIRWIQQNRGLKKLQANIQMNSDELLGLLEQLPELEEISITWDGEFRNSLQVILQGAHKVNTINMYYSGRMNVEEIETITPVNWQFVESKSGNSFSFIRKH